MSRTARLLTVTTTALLTGLLACGPALADNPLAPQEGADTSAGIGTGTALLLYLVVPAAILLGIAALVWLPNVVRANKYRPARGWSAPPVWFGGPADPVAAVETAQTAGVSRGGASGDW